MTMILIVIILTLVAGGFGYLYKQTRKKLKKERSLVKEYKQSIKERDHAIRAMEEVYREEGEKKKRFALAVILISLMLLLISCQTYHAEKPDPIKIQINFPKFPDPKGNVSMKTGLSPCLWIIGS